MSDRARSGRQPRVASPAVFLDRDGVINADSPDFVTSLEAWRPLPGSLEAIARLSQAGYCVAVVTNQSALARGLIDAETLEAIHARLRGAVEARGGRIDGIFHCPHAPGAGCRCRKPAPGLIEAACRALGVEASGALLIGDRISDVEAARAAGCRPILVRSGRVSEAEALAAQGAGVAVYRDLPAAVEAILSDVAPARPLASKRSTSTP